MIQVMNVIDLMSADLNLLLVLYVLLQERSVSRSAQRLGRTQSAMSHALSRLRELFGDPILVRVGNSMVPTPLARSLEAPLHALLVQTGQLLTRREVFDPSSLDRRFTVATTDMGEFVLFPALLERLREVAPGVRLAIVDGAQNTEDLIAKGAIEMAVGTFFEARGGLVLKKLYDESFHCLVPEALDVELPLSLDAFAALDHALITPRNSDGGVVDVALAKVGLERRVVYRSTHFVSAAWVAAHNGLLLTLPSRPAHLLARNLPIRLAEPPLRLPRFTLSIAFHELHRGDPAHQWLRETMVEVAAGLSHC